MEIENGKWKTQLLRAKNTAGNDCLHIACEKGDADTVALLMESGLGGTSVNKVKMNPLHVAVHKRQYPCVEEILRNSKEKEKVLEPDDIETDTPLQLAIKRKEDKIVQQLLESYKKQNVSLSDEKRKKLLSLSAKFENSNVFKYSLNASDKNRLHVIAEFGREEWLATYCDKDRYGNLINVNTKDDDENTPLHLATKNDHLGTVKLLLNMGGDVQIEDEKGRNSIQIAIESGAEKCLQHLMSHIEEKNISIHLKLNENEENALQKAIRNKDEKIIKTVIESDFWKEYLQVGTLNKDGLFDTLDTPMRQLIRNFPDMAETVLDKCKVEKNDEVECNYEFLEDTYKYRLEDKNQSSKDKKQYKYVNSQAPKREPEPYTNDGDLFIKNHPLMKINDYKHPRLLMHEVTKSLINHKWENFGLHCYYANLVFYACFLATLTTNVMTSYWPQDYVDFYSCTAYFNERNFTNAEISELPKNAITRNTPNYASRVFIGIFATIRFTTVIIGHENKWVFKVSSEGIKAVSTQLIMYITYLHNAFSANCWSVFLDKEEFRGKEYIF